MNSAFGEVVESLRRFTVQVRAHRNGSGSGVVWSADGRVVTNAHVVEGASGSTVEVEFWDGRRLPGRVLKQDRRRDLAALQVEAAGLHAASFGDSRALQAGQLVIAVGNPFGFTGAASMGIVHQRREAGLGPDDEAWVVSQLRLAPGNSGGPLANAAGEVIGINTMIARGLAFAVPSQAVLRFLRTPVSGIAGRQRSGLGMLLQPVVTNDWNGQRTEFVVLEIRTGSPAEQASLLQGDVLVGAGGQKFWSASNLEAAVRATRHGTLTLQFRRGAQPSLRTVTVQLQSASVSAA